MAERRARAELAQPNPVREKELEAKDKKDAMQGIVADLVLIYPIETAEEMETEVARKEFDKLRRRTQSAAHSRDGRKVTGSEVAEDAFEDEAVQVDLGTGFRKVQLHVRRTPRIAILARDRDPSECSLLSSVFARRVSPSLAMKGVCAVIKASN
jgi:hypothetical protein